MGHADGDIQHSNEQKATLTESPPLGHADCDFQYGHEHKSTLQHETDDFEHDRKQ